MGHIIRDLWCIAFHVGHERFEGFGCFFFGGRKTYGEKLSCRLCGRQWVREEQALF